MPPPKKGCWTCGWAKWVARKNGKKSRAWPGWCRWQQPATHVFPVHVSRSGRIPLAARTVVWPNDGEKCLCWKPEGDD